MITLKFEDSILKFDNKELTCQPGAEALMSWVKNNRSDLMRVKGVYIISIFDTGSIGNPRPIYIGKANPLYNRLYEHCKEMMPELCSESKLSKDSRWIDVFSEYRDEELIIEFIELDREVDRRWLESNLHQSFDTIFDHKKV
tara:strand:+ start:4807 stop:5232 length:426 start_codon:yes stop_codon:yes gene_type:complete